MGQLNTVFIDLPGQPISHPAFSGQLDIILRRHRDIVIDINLPSPFKSFDLVAEKDWFYDEKKKVRVQKATFSNGQRAHVWVSRDFKGKLFLKSGSIVYSTFDVESIFRSESSSAAYGDYKYKPAPLILTATESNGRVETSEHQEVMHVIAVNVNSSTPDYVVKFIQSGAASLGLDSQGVITLNWICTQIAAASGVRIDNNIWYRELKGIKINLVRVIHKSGPKYYIVFKGTTGSRQYLTAARYGAGNAKVLSILAGAGSFKGTAQAAWNAANPAIIERQGGKVMPRVTGAGIAVLFSIAISTAEWYADYTHPVPGQPRKDLFDLAGSVGIGLAKTLIAGAVGSAISSLIATSMLGVAAVTPVGWVVLIGGLVISVGVGFLMDYMDKKEGVTDGASVKMRSAWKYLTERSPNQYPLAANPNGGYFKLHPAVVR
ncbi:hypothetical protein [Chromobacterium sinusclupearum]|uniref:hypothetical protein n=1 Tax=Chromobacterium sinusclupearum TaxID=2077146 RepID=UPI0011AFC802|nr:hypothetical protein [Chromobacterium sinusclupearum]